MKCLQWGHFWVDFIFMRKLYKPYLQDAAYEIRLDNSFVRRRALNVLPYICLCKMQSWIPIPQRCFIPNLVEISSVVLEKKSFKAKVYRQMDSRLDMITIAHLSLWLRWAKKLNVNNIGKILYKLTTIILFILSRGGCKNGSIYVFLQHRLN